jgi:integrase
MQANQRVAAQRDAKVGVFTRPQAGLADFYREMGDLFGVALRPHNRYAGSKILRERWQTHIDASLSRPLLIVDEAQETSSSVLAELRLLSAVRLDSQVLLTVILAGDRRLVERSRSDEFLPVGSRIRVRLMLERASSDELQDCLRHALHKAGAPQLMTPELIATLALEQIRRVLAIPFKKSNVRLVPHLGRDEIQALLNAPDPATRDGIRDRAMLHLAVCTGLRVSELTGLCIEMWRFLQ